MIRAAGPIETSIRPAHELWGALAEMVSMNFAAAAWPTADAATASMLLRQTCQTDQLVLGLY